MCQTVRGIPVGVALSFASSASAYCMFAHTTTQTTKGKARQERRGIFEVGEGEEKKR